MPWQGSCLGPSVVGGIWADGRWSLSSPGSFWRALQTFGPVVREFPSGYNARLGLVVFPYQRCLDPVSGVAVVFDKGDLLAAQPESVTSTERSIRHQLSLSVSDSQPRDEPPGVGDNLVFFVFRVCCARTPLALVVEDMAG